MENVAEVEVLFLKPNVMLIIDLCNPAKPSLSNSLDIVLGKLSKIYPILSYTVVFRDSMKTYIKADIRADGQFKLSHLSNNNLQQALNILSKV